MITGFVADNGRLRTVPDTLENLASVVWIDLLNPTQEEETLLEGRLGIDIPTREEMEEIEVSSRLYVEEGAVFMTASLPARTDTDDLLMGPVTFVLAGKKLITVRYHEPRAFTTFPQRAEKVSLGCSHGEAVLIALLEASVDRLADILERVQRDVDTISRDIFRDGSAKQDLTKVLQRIGRKGDLSSHLRDSLVSLQRLAGFFGQMAAQQENERELRGRVKTLGRDVQSLTDHSSFLSAKITFLLDATLGVISIEQSNIIKIFSIAAGIFLPPTLIEIGRLSDLEYEVFGPVLHVVRFRREGLDALVDGINRLEFGLTLGVHSRVDETIDRIVSRARVGNVYVNRNIVGAVVGVQPFGGEGLSGTGPKAGGPMYLYRLLSRFPPDAAVEELRVLDESGLRASLKAYQPALAPFEALRLWAKAAQPRLALLCDRLAAFSAAGAEVALPGPTGERNTYSTRARHRILCLAHDDLDLEMQIAAALSVGARAVLPASDRATRVLRSLPAEATRAVDSVSSDISSLNVDFDAVLHHGTADQCRAVLRKVAERPGPLVSVHAFNPGEEPIALERLLIERVVSVNTAAAGGNASLMTIG